MKTAPLAIATGLIAMLAAPIYPALAQTPEIQQTSAWSGPDAKRRPDYKFGSGDIDYALSDMCFPFLIGDADPANLITNPRVIDKQINGEPPAGTLSTNGYYIANDTTEVVAFDREEGGICVIRLTKGNPQKLLATALDRLGEWPATFTPAATQFVDEGYLETHSWCGPADAEDQDMLQAKLGDGSGARSQEGITLTIGRLKATRQAACG